jgi:hypothetical protein
MRPGVIRINCLRSQPTADFLSPDLINFADLSPSAWLASTKGRITPSNSAKARA